MKVRKAVIAAAGFGTRFLPQTKVIPKEMLPLIDKPIIQYIVEELVAAGIESIVIVTGYHKRSIEDHFDQMSADLRENLKRGGKLGLLKATENISNLANFSYVRQKGPYGTAAPLLNVWHLVGEEPFLYVFADELIVAKPNCYIQMINLHGELNGSILPCVKLDQPEQYSRYGVFAGKSIRNDVIKITGVVEKPGIKKAPSRFGSIGGYLLEPNVLEYLESGVRRLRTGQEFYLTDSVIDPMIKDGHAFFGCEIKNSRLYDTGNKLDYLKAVADFAINHEDFGQEFIKYLRSIISIKQ